MTRPMIATLLALAIACPVMAEETSTGTLLTLPQLEETQAPEKQPALSLDETFTTPAVPAVSKPKIYWGTVGEKGGHSLDGDGAEIGQGDLLQLDPAQHEETAGRDGKGDGIGGKGVEHGILEAHLFAETGIPGKPGQQRHGKDEEGEKAIALKRSAELPHLLGHEER